MYWSLCIPGTESERRLHMNKRAHLRLIIAFRGGDYWPHFVNMCHWGSGSSGNRLWEEGCVQKVNWWLFMEQALNRNRPGLRERLNGTDIAMKSQVLLFWFPFVPRASLTLFYDSLLFPGSGKTLFLKRWTMSYSCLDPGAQDLHILGALKILIN